jgi:WD40 repeat protein/subtilisin-like proprotein convertase family protein
MSEETSKPEQPVSQDQTESTGEFFTIGTPLHAVRAGYIKRKADDILYNALLSGRFARVLAPVRSGKTSLIAATAARLEAIGCKIAVLDLAQIGTRDGGPDAGRWFYNVAYRLMRQLRIRYDLQSWWHDRSMLSNRQRLLEFYSEIVLQSVSERIVVFVDEITCLEELPFADQLLGSIRAAHNARTTDPEFLRLTFVLLGECDPASLIPEPEMSPFIVAQQVVLDDFTREQLDLFATELGLDSRDAERALDRIYYWSRGQPYLTQKMARQVARDEIQGDVAAHVDHLATTQLAGRAALHSEPHMAHIHRAIVNDRKSSEALLTLYGKVRKGIEISADLGSALHRRLLALGLLVIDHDGNLAPRNRLYESVFTARWANENLRTRLRVPVAIVGALVLLMLVPFWYTQWLPRPYMRVLTSPTVELETAQEAYENLRSFPGHSDTADYLFRGFVEMRSELAADAAEIEAIAELSRKLPDSGRLPDTLLASFWDRQSRAAMRDERRDTALMATLEALALPTPHRRQRAASLVGEDYPLLLASLAPQPATTTVFDPANQLLTFADGARISQWSHVTQQLQQRDSWSITALEIVPLVRRVVVDRSGIVSRIGLTLNLSHARLDDLRIKVIAPSGRAVEIEPGRERASSNEDIAIPAEQLHDLVGESLPGTWSISIRDEALGVAGQLVGWNLKLNAQGAVEDFQRGLNIPDPLERETENTWFDRSGRYAVARAMQSDSARIWDLAFGEPVRVVAVNENEKLVGLDNAARHLVTATRDTVSIWDTATGDRAATLAVGAASDGAVLTGDGTHLFVEHHGDTDTRLELWSLDAAEIVAELVVAGRPAHVAVDPTGSRVAVADYDRAVRIWDFASGDLVAQIDLPMQPSEIQLANGGEALGTVHGRAGVTVWNVDRPRQPLVETFAVGDWQLVFSPSGTRVLAGRPASGFQLYSTRDARLAGPPISVGGPTGPGGTRAFSNDEKVIFAGSPQGVSRFWRTPAMPQLAGSDKDAAADAFWLPAADQVTLALPAARGIVIGDPEGHVHILRAAPGAAEIDPGGDELSYFGHTSKVVQIAADATGSLVASAAADNSIRVWNTDDGQPRPWVARLEGNHVAAMAFSPDAAVLAVLRGSVLSLLGTGDGATVAEFDLGTVHGSQAFAADGRLYVGSEDGVLRQVGRESDGVWTVRQLWRGPHPIRRLGSSPRGNFLVIVDSGARGRLFNLADGNIGEQVLDFPRAVEEIAFGRSNSRAMFRTARWVHRVSLSANGLHWIDSAFAPMPLNGGRMVFGTGEAARRAYLPAARNGVVELVELAFPGSSHPGLFGNREDLLHEWRARLAYLERDAASD